MTRRVRTWRALPDRAFARAWRGLTKHPAATLAEIAGEAEGARES